MAQGRERRRSPRVALDCHVRYRVMPVTTGGYQNALVRDVSLTGFRFHAASFLPHSASFLVEMGLPGHAPVRSLARAAWVREMPGDDGFEIGAVFVEPPRMVQSAIAGCLVSPERPQIAVNQ